MGSITSRKEWPPKPTSYVPQYERKLVLKDGKWVSVQVKSQSFRSSWAPK